MISKHKVRRFPLFAVGIAAGALAMGAVTNLTTSFVEESATREAEAVTAAKANAEQVERLGAKPAAEPPKAEPSQRVTEDQVRAIVRAEMAGLTLSDSQIAEIAELATSPEDILDAVEQVCANDACDGDDGQDGAEGAAGLSAYELAVDNGFEGSLDEWLASLQGPAGQDGADGQDGVDGQDGEDGADGRDGVDGKDGKDGADGPACPDGAEPRAWHIRNVVQAQATGLPRGTSWWICPLTHERGDG